MITRLAGTSGLALAALLSSAAPASPAAEISFDVHPRVAQVGDAIDAVLQVDLPQGSELRRDPIGPDLGSFHVIEGSWSGPEAIDSASRWTWRGRLAAFETGQLEIPAITLEVVGPAGSERASTEAIPVTIESVLTAEEREQSDLELSDLKAPVSVRPAYGPLWIALGALGALLLGAGLLWWLHRRYASRLAAVAAPDDPFHRTPPHVWIYGELKRLLERGLPEQGRVDTFYAELSRILKRYLSGRYRVELIERTSAEAPGLLRQAGAAEEAISAVEALLAECDQVKFARNVPGPDACRDAVERVYRIVDMTRPSGVDEAAAQRGAA